MAGQNAHLDLKYYETSSAQYNHRQRSFHEAYKLRGNSDFRDTPTTVAEPLVTFPLFRRDEHGFRRYYDSVPLPVPAMTAAESLKAPFPSGTHALWELKQGFFPGPGAVSPQPKPNDQRSHSSAQRPLTFPYGTTHIESRGVESDTTHTRIGKQRQFAVRQTRTPRNLPLSVLTPSERAAIADPSFSVNLQEIQQLRRSHGTGSISAPPVLSSSAELQQTPRVEYSAAGWPLNQPAGADPPPTAEQLTSRVTPAPLAQRIPKFEKLSADLSRPVSQWNDVYHQHVHYPKSRQMNLQAQLSASQTLKAPLQLARTQEALPEAVPEAVPVVSV